MVSPSVTSLSTPTAAPAPPLGRAAYPQRERRVLLEQVEPVCVEEKVPPGRAGRLGRRCILP